MKVLVVTPSFNIHGGIRIILEWANRLTRWHKVSLYAQEHSQLTWFKLNDQVNVVRDINDLRIYDALIITSPLSMEIYNRSDAPERKLVFMQMCEHLFYPKDKAWQERCRQFYSVREPIIAISKWNIECLQFEYWRKSPIYYLSNGINLEDFPIKRPEKDGKTVLIEGWGGYNDCKDTGHVAIKVARMLHRGGYTIVAYSQLPMVPAADFPVEFHERPGTELMNELYERATILLKASRFDARSTSPIEAMTKGCITARAITKGDDDLVDMVNCLRCEYDVKQLYKIAVDLLTDEANIRQGISNRFSEYLQKNCNWDLIISDVNRILISI